MNNVKKHICEGNQGYRCKQLAIIEENTSDGLQTACGTLYSLDKGVLNVS